MKQRVPEEELVTDRKVWNFENNELFTVQYA